MPCLQKLCRDEAGFVLAGEFVMTMTIVTLGLALPLIGVLQKVIGQELQPTGSDVVPFEISLRYATLPASLLPAVTEQDLIASAVEQGLDAGD